MKNKKMIILLSEENVFMEKVFNYNIRSADIVKIPTSYSPFDREELASRINKEYSQVIFYGFFNQFYLLLPLLSKKIIKKYILNVSITRFNEAYIFDNFQQIIEYQERGLIDYIFTTQYDLYVSFKNKLSYIILDYIGDDKKKNSNSDSIGILNEYYLIESNFYNELSAIALSKYKKAFILDQNIITKQFGLDFGVELYEEKDIEKLIYKNKANLDCKFCEISNINFLISMDAGIPCILGNTNLLDDNVELKKMLVLESDDDINEIKDKLESSIANIAKINNIYSKWRVDYSNKSKKTIKGFIEMGES